MQQVIDMMNQNECLLYEKWENSVESLKSIDSDKKQKLFDMIFTIISRSDEKSADYLRDWYERYFIQVDSLTYLVKSIQSSEGLSLNLLSQIKIQRTW